VRAALDARRPQGGWRRALDVGCGDALFLDTLGAYASHVEGLEPDDGLLSAATRAGGRVHAVPFDQGFQPTARYDLMLFLDVIEHLDDARGALAHAAELMHPRGTLLITVPAFLHLWTTHDDLNLHRTRYTKSRLRSLVSEHFVVDEIRYFFRWVHAAKLAQRASELLRRPEPGLPGIPPEPVNRTLLGLSRVEEALLRHIPVPFGSSLLAVAHKVGP